MIIGIIGLVILVSAWLYETIDGVRKHKNLIDLRFAVIYLTGIFFLTVYTQQIGDRIYLALNVILMAIILSEIIYTLYVHKVRR